MKSIFIIPDMDSDLSAKRIEVALEYTRVKFEIIQEDKIILIEGDSEMVSVAKNVIKHIGFTVE